MGERTSCLPAMCRRCVFVCDIESFNIERRVRFALFRPELNPRKKVVIPSDGDKWLGLIISSRL